MSMERLRPSVVGDEAGRGRPQHPEASPCTPHTEHPIPYVATGVVVAAIAAVVIALPLAGSPGPHERRRRPEARDQRARLRLASTTAGGRVMIGE